MLQWKEQKKLEESFNIRNGEELTKIFLKSVVIFLTCVFEEFIEVSINEFDISPLYSESLSG